MIFLENFKIHDLVFMISYVRLLKQISKNLKALYTKKERKKKSGEQAMYFEILPEITDSKPHIRC